MMKDYEEGLKLPGVKKLLGKTGSDIQRYVHNGQLIALRVRIVDNLEPRGKFVIWRKCRYRYPQWQFDELASRFLPIALLLIFTKLPRQEKQLPWNMYQTARSFLFHPNRHLGERTIFEVLRGRNKRLIRKALSLL